LRLPLEQQPALRRSLGLPHATAIVVGIIVGSSIFAQPSEITRLVPSTRWGMLVWSLAGLLTFCGALVCAQLAQVFPETGGVYIFLKRIFSPALAFLWGWAMFWSMHSGIIAAIAVIMARYAGYFVPLSETGIRIVAIAAVLSLSFVNYLGVKTGGTLQLALTAAKVAAIAAMVLLLFAFGAPAHSRLGAQAVLHADVSLKNAGLAIAAGLFAFGGWHMVTYTAGETRAPERTVPRALLIGTLIVTACYMLLNVAYQYVLTASEVSQSTRVAVGAMQRVLGGRIAGVIAILVIVSALGSLNGIILAGPRVYFAMAEDRLAFRWMAAIHPRRHTPHLAIAAQAAIACVLIASNSYRQLFTRVVYTEWIFFALLAVGLIRLRQQHKIQIAGIKVAIAAVFSITAIAVAVNQAAADLRSAAWGCAQILLGLPVYLVWARRRPPVVGWKSPTTSVGGTNEL
jgi:APA family basic amino acid/polyamine antiporter